MKFLEFLIKGKCKSHFNKFIFRTEKEATLFAKSMFPNEPCYIYVCPQDNSHFHFADAVKRKKKHRKRWKNNVKARKIGK